MILEELSVFWANTEVVLDLLSKKGEHVEQFVGFATKPKLMARFLERMEEYKRFWENVSMMCSNYIAGVQTTNEQQRMYGFLDLDTQNSHSSSSKSSETSAPVQLERWMALARRTPFMPSEPGASSGVPLSTACAKFSSTPECWAPRGESNSMTSVSQRTAALSWPDRRTTPTRTRARSCAPERSGPQ